MTQEEVLTLEQVADFLKVSETTAYNLARTGEIPSRKVGREWRFLKNMLIEWLKDGKDSMNTGIVQVDSFGGEFKVEAGQEKIALWLPLSLAEKGALLKKAQEEGVSISEIVADHLRNWLTGTIPSAQ